MVPAITIDSDRLRGYVQGFVDAYRDDVDVLPKVEPEFRDMMVQSVFMLAAKELADGVDADNLGPFPLSTPGGGIRIVPIAEARDWIGCWDDLASWPADLIGEEVDRLYTRGERGGRPRLVRYLETSCGVHHLAKDPIGFVRWCLLLAAGDRNKTIIDDWLARPDRPRGLGTIGDGDDDDEGDLDPLDPESLPASQPDSNTPVGLQLRRMLDSLLECVSGVTNKAAPTPASLRRIAFMLAVESARSDLSMWFPEKLLRYPIGARGEFTLGEALVGLREFRSEPSASAEDELGLGVAGSVASGGSVVERALCRDLLAVLGPAGVLTEDNLYARAMRGRTDLKSWAVGVREGETDAE